jgi:hypothetical protein
MNQTPSHNAVYHDPLPDMNYRNPQSRNFSPGFNSRGYSNYRTPYNQNQYYNDRHPSYYNQRDNYRAPNNRDNYQSNDNRDNYRPPGKHVTFNTRPMIHYPNPNFAYQRLTQDTGEAHPQGVCWSCGDPNHHFYDCNKKKKLKMPSRLETCLFCGEKHYTINCPYQTESEINQPNPPENINENKSSPVPLHPNPNSPSATITQQY